MVYSKHTLSECFATNRLVGIWNYVTIVVRPFFIKKVPCVEFTSCHASPCLLSQGEEIALQDNNNASDHELKFYGANGHA